MRKLLATTIVGAVSIIGAATAWAVTGTSGTSTVDGPELPRLHAAGRTR